MRHFAQWVVAGVWVTGLGLAGCTASSGDAGRGGAGAGGSTASGTNGPTFHKDVEPLLQAHCLSCHSEGQIGGFSLAAYDDAKKLAPLIAMRTASGTMPPFPAQETDECHPRGAWRNDPRLSADQIAMLKAWSDAGAPEGDPKDAPPPFVLAEPGLPNPSLEITAPAPITVTGGGKDQFVCVVYDPQLTETKWLDGLHFVAGNAKVAHHALLFRAPRADVAAQSGGQSQYPCFGAPPGTLLNAWAPGSVPLELPANIGMQMGKDDLIVIQMHYHPRATDEVDQSKVQLRFASSAPKWSYITALIGNAATAADGLLPDPDDKGAPEFLIPANKTSHTEEMTYTIKESDTPVALPILAVGTHMHYVGVDMKFSIERATGNAAQPANECLVETPHWDFNWQRWYQYDLPVESLPTVGPGDTLRMRCTYDNSMQNPFVAQALKDQGLSAPRDVSLGEMTLDEMCLGVAGILVPN